jgi:hypothetical protein
LSVDKDFHFALFLKCGIELNIGERKVVHHLMESQWVKLLQFWEKHKREDEEVLEVEALVGVVILAVVEEGLVEEVVVILMEAEIMVEVVADLAVVEEVVHPQVIMDQDKTFQMYIPIVFTILSNKKK